MVQSCTMKTSFKILPGTVRPHKEFNDPIDEITHPAKAKREILEYIQEELLVLNFYRTHFLYFIVVILLCSVIVYGEGLANDPDEIGGSRLRYVDALFLCCSAMTTTGELDRKHPLSL
jgi:hypothetical protein